MGSGVKLYDTHLQAANLAALPPGHEFRQPSPQHSGEPPKPSLPSCPEESSVLAGVQPSSPRQPPTPEATDDSCPAESRNSFFTDSQLATDQSGTLAQPGVQGLPHPFTRLAATSWHNTRPEQQQPAEAAAQPAGCLQQDGSKQRAMLRDRSHSMPAQAFLRPVLTRTPAESTLQQPSTAWTEERDDAQMTAADLELTSSDRDTSGEEHALTPLISGAAGLLAGVGQWGFDTFVLSQVGLPDHGPSPQPLSDWCEEVL